MPSGGQDNAALSDPAGMVHATSAADGRDPAERDMADNQVLIIWLKIAGLILGLFVVLAGVSLLSHHIKRAPPPAAAAQAGSAPAPTR